MTEAATRRRASASAAVGSRGTCVTSVRQGTSTTPSASYVGAAQWGQYQRAVTLQAAVSASQSLQDLAVSSANPAFTPTPIVKFAPVILVARQVMAAVQPVTANAGPTSLAQPVISVHLVTTDTPAAQHASAPSRALATVPVTRRLASATALRTWEVSTVIPAHTEPTASLSVKLVLAILMVQFRMGFRLQLVPVTAAHMSKELPVTPANLCTGTSLRITHTDALAVAAVQKARSAQSLNAHRVMASASASLTCAVEPARCARMATTIWREQTSLDVRGASVISAGL